MGDSCLEGYKPGLAMVVTQCIYAAMALSAKAAFTEGMNTMVFVVYRQAIATLVLAPTTILAKVFSLSLSLIIFHLSLSLSLSLSLLIFHLWLSRGNLSQMSLGWRAFCLVFVASLVG